MKLLRELFEDTIALPGLWPNVPIDYLTNRSQDLLDHSYGCPIFFAMRGQNFDGNDFIPQLVGTAKIFVSDRERPADLPDGCLWIRPKSVRDSWTFAQRQWFSLPDRDLALFAVTGTNGKTTTVFAIQHLFGSGCGRITTIDCQWRNFQRTNERTTLDGRDFYAFLAKARSAGLAAMAFEASSQGLDQGRLYGAAIDTAIWTNLTRDHLDYHGSMAAYCRAKARLFDGSNGSSSKRILLNGDSVYAERLADLCPAGSTLLRFGSQKKNDFRLLQRSGQGGRTTVTYQFQGQSITVTVPIFGAFNCMNLLAAAAALIDRVPLATLAERMESFVGAPGRLERMAAPFPCFVDYAHTPDGLAKVLGAVKEAFPDRPVVLVFGCGGDRDRGKRPAMVRSACRGASFVFFTADNPRTEPLAQIFADGLAGGTFANLLPIADRREAIAAAAIRALRSGGVLLIAGKGHEQYQEIGSMRHPFDDRAVLRSCLDSLD